MAKRDGVHVTPHDDGWQVRREGAQRASSVHATQADAEQSGRATARREGTEFYLHGRAVASASGTATATTTSRRAAEVGRECLGPRPSWRGRKRSQPPPVRVWACHNGVSPLRARRGLGRQKVVVSSGRQTICAALRLDRSSLEEGQDNC